MTIVIPLVASPVLPGSALSKTWDSPLGDYYRSKRPDWALANYATGWTGINFRAMQEGQGFQLALPTYLVTLGLGAIAHKIAGLLGINRMLGRARVPLIRV